MCPLLCSYFLSWLSPGRLYASVWIWTSTNEYSHISCHCFTLLCFTGVVFYTKCRQNPPQAKTITPCLIVVVWNETCNISSMPAFWCMLLAYDTLAYLWSLPLPNSSMFTLIQVYVAIFPNKTELNETLFPAYWLLSTTMNVKEQKGCSDSSDRWWKESETSKRASEGVLKAEALVSTQDDSALLNLTVGET